MAPGIHVLDHAKRRDPVSRARMEARLMVEPDPFLPLTQTTFLILASLRDGPKHGYAIAKEVERLSEHTVRLGVGNLYVSLSMLIDAGLVVRADRRAVDRRKTHRVTALA